MDIIPSMMRFIREEMRRQSAGSLSVPQFRSLAFLDGCPGAALTDLAEHLGVTSPTASTMVERLVQQGYVRRRTSAEERRRHQLTLTKEGRALLDSSRGVTRQRIEAALETFSDSELAKVEEALLLLDRAFRRGSSST